MESCHIDHTAGNLGKTQTFYMCIRCQNIFTGLAGALHDRWQLCPGKVISVKMMKVQQNLRRGK